MRQAVSYPLLPPLRRYAYVWRKQKQQMPRLEAVLPSAAQDKIPRRVGKVLYSRVETQPGLDKYVGDAKGLAELSLGPLLDWARAVVPAAEQRDTPLFLLATAGVRKLSDDAQQALLRDACEMLGGSGFRFEPSWARVIDGVDEGKYGWVATNYQLGSFDDLSEQGATGQRAAEDDRDDADSPDRAEHLLHGSAQDQRTIGSLDLGGSSLEVGGDQTRTCLVAPPFPSRH